MEKILKTFLFLVFLTCGQSVQAYTSPGSPTGFVTDFANIISDPVQSSIENQLKVFSASTTIEIAVVTVNSLEGDSVESYANNLFREWGIGKKESNNGILFLVAPNDRKARIEVGYGLEGVMPDIQAGYIMDNIIIPEFKNGNYEDGIISGVSSIQSVVKGEKFDVPSQDSKQGSAEGILFLFGIFILQGVMALLASTKSWWLGGIFGVVAGFVVSYILNVPGFDWIFIVVLGVTGLFFDYVISKSYKRYLARGGTKTSWGWIGGRGSGGSGGGFGGGSSGGGGASGSW